MMGGVEEVCGGGGGTGMQRQTQDAITQRWKNLGCSMIRIAVAPSTLGGQEIELKQGNTW